MISTLPKICPQKPRAGPWTGLTHPANMRSRLSDRENRLFIQTEVTRLSFRSCILLAFRILGQLISRNHPLRTCGWPPQLLSGPGDWKSSKCPLESSKSTSHCHSKPSTGQAELFLCPRSAQSPSVMPLFSQVAWAQILCPSWIPPFSSSGWAPSSLSCQYLPLWFPLLEHGHGCLPHFPLISYSGARRWPCWMGQFPTPMPIAIHFSYSALFFFCYILPSGLLKLCKCYLTSNSRECSLWDGRDFAVSLAISSDPRTGTST